jgi:hypothetical protein
MLYRNRKSRVRFIVGAFLVFFLFAATAGPVMAESAADYGALFDVKSQFNPSALTATNGEYHLAYPRVAPPYVVPPGLFRVLIPAGAVKVGLEFYASTNTMVGMVARYDLPPQSDYSQINATYWDCYPWNRDATGGLTNADMRFRNQGGHGTIMYQPLGSPLTQGGWVYIKVLGSGVYHFQYNVWVDAAAYSAWHASGAEPAASGTVAGSPIFAPISGCSPTDPQNPNPDPTTPTNPFSQIWKVAPKDPGDNTNPWGLLDGIFGDKTSNPGIGTKTRLDVEIDTTVNGSGGVRIVTETDLLDYKSVILKPSLKIEGLPSGEVDRFAVISANGSPLLINRETLFSGPAWMVFGGSDRIYKYGRETLGEGGTWACNAFDFLASYNPGIPPSVFTENRLQFIFAIAPVGEVEMGKYENLRFGVIAFQPDVEETEDPAPDPEPEGASAEE